jgi:CheY-like chemotaxis protein
MARILLVNDEADLVEVMGMILSEDGHIVEAVIDGPAAFATALGFAPDLVVLDWRLNGITADEIVRQLRLDPRTARLPILLVSAMQDAGDRARLLGLDGHLRKPFTAEALLRAVNGLLSAGDEAQDQR